jgi:hypothetical protein
MYFYNQLKASEVRGLVQQGIKNIGRLCLTESSVHINKVAKSYGFSFGQEKNKTKQ